MAGLAVSDLTNTYNLRNNRDFVGKYEYRRDRFLEKAKNREPFELTNGDEVFINIPNSKDFLEKIQKLKPNDKNSWLGKALVVPTREDSELSKQDLTKNEVDFKEVPLSAFQKTEEFGSSKETVAGSTEDVESMVAAILAFNLAGRMRTDIIPTIGDLEQLIAQKKLVLGPKISVDSLHASLDALSVNTNASWYSTILDSAYLIERDCKLNKNYSIYRSRSEGVPGRIYKLFNKYNERYGQPDKWNPADIWAIKDGYEFTEAGITDWTAFNQKVRTAFDERNAIGISLKQLGSNPSVELVNETGKEKDTSHWVSLEELEKATFRITGKSSCKLVIPSRGDISFRCANVSGATGFNAEVGWSQAAQDGKAGLPAINFEFKKQGADRKLPQPLGLQSDLVQQLGIEGSKVQQDFISLLQEAGLDPANYLDNTPGGRISKYLGLIVYHNYTQEGFDKVSFINGILDYAMSRTDEAAPHYKIH